MVKVRIYKYHDPQLYEAFMSYKNSGKLIKECLKAYLNNECYSWEVPEEKKIYSKKTINGIITINLSFKSNEFDIEELINSVKIGYRNDFIKTIVKFYHSNNNNLDFFFNKDSKFIGKVMINNNYFSTSENVNDFRNTENDNLIEKPVKTSPQKEESVSKIEKPRQTSILHRQNMNSGNDLSSLNKQNEIIMKKPKRKNIQQYENEHTFIETSDDAINNSVNNVTENTDNNLNSNIMEGLITIF